MSAYMQPVRASQPDNLSGTGAVAGLVAGLPFEGGEGVLRPYRAIAAQLPRGALFIVDTDLRYLLAAGSALGLSGFAAADFEGRLLCEALPPNLVAQHTRDYQTILGGATLVREHCSGGVWYESHGLPLADERGRIRAALVISHDISQRKRQAERLQALDRLACAVAEATDPKAIGAAAAGLLEEYFGPVRCTIAGVDDGCDCCEIDGIPLTRFGADTPARLARGEMLGSSKGADTRGLPVRSFLLCPHLAGGRLAGITAILSGAPLAWSAEDRAFVCELTRRAWAHIERLRLLEALQETGRRKDGQLAVLANELRQPMTMVRNSLALLGRPGTAVMPQAVLPLVERQFGHMNRVLEDALDTSYISHRPAAPCCRCLDLQEVVRAAVETARVLVPARTHMLALSMPAQPIPVWVDPARLAQALNNVLANALKYSPLPAQLPAQLPLQLPIRVEVEVERRGAEALVRVVDKGVGMSPRTLACLAELFGREDAPLPAGGLGVGLWIARRLVESHGGSMRADSLGPDQGSTITIILPVLAVH